MGPERQLYISLFLFGMATLLPWNFFITPFAYWMSKLTINGTEDATDSDQPAAAALQQDLALPENVTASVVKDTRSFVPVDPDSNNQSCAGGDFTMNTYQKFWGSLLGITTMSTNLIFCFLTTMLAQKVSRNVRFIGCLIGYIICLTITLLMVKLDSSTWVPTFFSATLIVVVVITICCAIFQTSIFGLAAMFPGEYGIMVAVMGGQGCGGIFACIVNIVTLAAFDSVEDSAFVFFLLAILFSAFALYLYLKMPNNELYKRHVIDVDTNNAAGASDNREEDKLVTENESEKPRAATDSEDIMNTMKFRDFIRSKLWPYMLSVFLVFVVTLGLFPGVAAFVKAYAFDCNNSYHTKWFVPIWCFTLFNVGDTCGRLLADRVSYPKPNQPFHLLGLCLVRFGFMIIFPMTNIPIPNRSTSIYLHSDIWYICIMALMSMTGGLLSSKAMAGAGTIAPHHLQDSTGNLMGTCLVAGLLGGASMSFVVLALV